MTRAAISVISTPPAVCRSVMVVRGVRLAVDALTYFPVAALRCCFPTPVVFRFVTVEPVGFFVVVLVVFLVGLAMVSVRFGFAGLWRVRGGAPSCSG